MYSDHRNICAQLQLWSASRDPVTSMSPFLRAPSILGSLIVPSSQKPTTKRQESIKRSADSKPGDPHKPSWFRRCTQFALAALKSHNTHSLVGNLVITGHLEWGSYLQAACAGLAVWNEMRETNAGAASLDGRKVASLRDLPLLIARSPGIFRYTLAAVFLQNAYEQGFASVMGLGTAFVGLAVGNILVGHDMNRDYFTRVGISRSVDASTRISSAWKQIGSILSSGAIYWGLADILVGSQGFYKAGLSFHEAPVMFQMGIGLAIASVVSACVLAKRSPDSPVPFILNAATNYVFGLANAVSDLGSLPSIFTGFLWGNGSVIIALKKYARQRRPIPPSSNPTA
jgi:hypothetical protein